MSESLKTSLQTEPDLALFDGQIQGLALTFYQNERPPCGLLGIMDWHFHGAISKYIRRGTVSGQIGECTYLPMHKNGVTLHIILAGAGDSPSPGIREAVPAATVQALQKNLVSLRLPKLGISKADFGNVNSEYFSKNFKGVPLWITP